MATFCEPHSHLGNSIFLIAGIFYRPSSLHPLSRPARSRHYFTSRERPSGAKTRRCSQPNMAHPRVLTTVPPRARHVSAWHARRRLGRRGRTTRCMDVFHHWRAARLGGAGPLCELHRIPCSGSLDIMYSLQYSGRQRCS